MSDSNFLRDFAGVDGAPPTTSQLYRAFVLLGSDFGYEEAVEGALEYLADFTQRWGKPSSDNLLAIARRFAPGQPRPTAESEVEIDADYAAIHDVALAGPYTPEEADTTFALATLGIMRTPEASSALLPYLTSPYAEERWQAAFGLVAMRDERVLPTLGQMLVEFIGPNQPVSMDGTCVHHFQILRSYLPHMLADWGNSRLAPFLRAALIATIRAEKIELMEPHGLEEEFMSHGRRFTGREAWSWYYLERREWVEEEHRLIYALGRLGAFGALAGVPTRPGIYYYWGGPPTTYMGDETGENPVEVDSSDFRVPESHADVFQGHIWRVHACCGFLEPQFRDQMEGGYFFADSPKLEETIERLLEERFGLDESERRQALEDYDQASFLTGTVSDYKQFDRQARENAEAPTRDE